MAFQFLLLIELSMLMCSCRSARPSQVALPYQVRFVKSGGIAGTNKRIEIAPLGQSSYQSRKGQAAYNLTHEELYSLRQLIIKIDTTKLKPEYNTDGKMFDGFKYNLTLGARSTIIYDGSIPDHLQPLLNFLNQILNKSNANIKK